MKTIAILSIGIFLFASRADSQLYFRKVLNDPIVNISNQNNESAWGDYDNDGDDDVVISSVHDSCGDCPSPLVMFRNNGDSSFTQVSGNAITNTIMRGTGIIWGDYDNDGWLDLFACGTLNAHNKLFHNDHNGNFTEVTTGIIVNDALSSSQSCAWGDYDKDGKLDLFVSNRFGKNFLYRNLGGGNFEKITSGAIVNDIGSSRGCAWGDYDNDGWDDLFVLNYEGLDDFLYHNNGDGTFTKITDGPEVNDELWGSACGWLDYDNDGWLDLYVTGNHNRLYHNNGDGTFSTANVILNNDASYGFTCGDYDNDGYTDFFEANIGSNNTLFRNNGSSGGFTKMISERPSQEGVWSVSCSMIDYNRDGMLDLFVSNRFDNLHNYLYRNIGAKKKYINVRLYGCENKFGVGARVKVVTSLGKQYKEVSSSCGWGSQNPYILHFGVDIVQTIDSIIVTWPSGIQSVKTYIFPNQNLQIKECTEGSVGTDPSNSAPIFTSEASNGGVVYGLNQNFPNPFNPETRISYSLAENSFVNLKVFDASGREVIQLVNEQQEAGQHSVVFNSGLTPTGSLPSGVYFYRISAGDFLMTRAMMMLK